MSRRVHIFQRALDIARIPCGFLAILALVIASAGMAVPAAAVRQATTPPGPTAMATITPTPIATATSGTSGSYVNGAGIDRGDGTGGTIRTGQATSARHLPLSEKHIYDPYRTVSDKEESSLEYDAMRLEGYGVPALVYIRFSEDTPAQSQGYADDLRTNFGVESAPGADDGLVILVNTSFYSSRTGTITLSYGTNTLPVQGLDEAMLNRILEEDMMPRMRQNKLFEALSVGLRRFGYYAEFIPGAPPATSSRQDAAASAIAIAAPIATLLIALALLWSRIGSRRRVPSWVPTALVWAGAGIAIALAPLSVYARSRLGIGCALVLLAALALYGISSDIAMPMRRRTASTRVARARGSLMRRIGNIRNRARHRNRPAGSAGAR